MTAATTCSYTSAPSNALDLEHCVKARRSPTRSWRTADRASRRPTICAPRTERFRPGVCLENPAQPQHKKKAALVTRPFSACKKCNADQDVVGQPAGLPL